MKSAFHQYAQISSSLAAMCVSNCEIHFCRTHKTLRLQPARRRCGEMADATDLKYAAMPRSNSPLPSYCRFSQWPGPLIVGNDLGRGLVRFKLCAHFLNLRCLLFHCRGESLHSGF